jgi:DNA-binding transcriptional LysR family regulator
MFQRSHPGVRVSIMPGPSAQTMDALRSHRAELGVVGGFAAAPEIEAEPLVEEEVVVVGSPRLASRRLSRKDAEAATWISLYEGSATRAAVEAAWADSGITPTRHLILTSWEAVKLAVARGDGVAGCSEFTVERELRAGTLVVLRLPGWKVRRTISIVRHRDAVLTPSAREFVAMLHARWGRSAARRSRRAATSDLSAALSSSARRRAP